MAYSSLSLRRTPASYSSMTPHQGLNRAMRPKVSNKVSTNDDTLSNIAPFNAGYDRYVGEKSAGDERGVERPIERPLQVDDVPLEPAVTPLSAPRKPLSRETFAQRHDKYRLRPRRTWVPPSISSKSGNSSIDSIQAPQTPAQR